MQEKPPKVGADLEYWSPNDSFGGGQPIGIDRSKRWVSAKLRSVSKRIAPVLRANPEIGLFGVNLTENALREKCSGFSEVCALSTEVLYVLPRNRTVF